jgi:AcrR family transcriptional regulator
MNMVHLIKTPSARQLRKQERRRDEILSAATLIVTSEGFDGFTMRKVAQELDCAVGAIYRYFPSKDHIISGLALQAIQEYEIELKTALERLIARTESVDEDVFALYGLLTLIDQYRNSSLEKPLRFSLVTHMIVDQRVLVEDDLRGQVMGSLFEALETVMHLLDRCVAVGALDPPRPLDSAAQSPHVERAFYLWSSMNGLIQVEKYRLKDLPFIDGAEMHHDLVRSILRGWGAQASTLEDAFSLLNVIRIRAGA